MSDSPSPRPGSIGWVDLTVPDAPRLRDFYQDVVGWATSELSMGAYNDYCMHVPDSNEMVAGVCHARGPNAEIPPVWLVYFTVADLHASAARWAERC